ncbi:MAG: nucleoside-diphosphate kinase [Actinomycetia bacterium]|nr:nucleoside-diphosphate kinase [Actinomycetes bacterium]
MEKTFTMIKPDGVEKKVIGKIVEKLEEKGLKILALKMEQLSKEKAKRLYAIHLGKDFYNELIDYVTSGPIVWMILEGENAVKIVRALMGATDPKEASPGTIRGDYGMSIDKNIIHGSDSTETAAYEISIFQKRD